MAVVVITTMLKGVMAMMTMVVMNICPPVVIMMMIVGVDTDVDGGVDVDYLSFSDSDGEGDDDGNDGDCVDDGGDGGDVDYPSTSSATPSFIAFKSHSRFHSIQLQDLQ